MASKLPYVVQPGSMVKILEKIRDAKTPDRFTHDFLETKLGFRGGGYQQFIPLAKKLGLLKSDGAPTDLYKSFRNPASSGAAMALAIKAGYREIFDRNEFANNLNKEEFKGLVVEITGLDSGDRVVQLICSTFENLKKLADFEQHYVASDGKFGEKVEELSSETEEDMGLDLRLSYTINLVLPKTDDPAVFNAIFRALRENLLRK
jgi:hypothetical protein